MEAVSATDKSREWAGIVSEKAKELGLNVSAEAIAIRQWGYLDSSSLTQ
jgi:hypothetical protein